LSSSIPSYTSINYTLSSIIIIEFLNGLDSLVASEPYRKTYGILLAQERDIGHGDGRSFEEAVQACTDTTGIW
jgi:hypothetical protein